MVIKLVLAVSATLKAMLMTTKQYYLICFHIRQPHVSCPQWKLLSSRQWRTSAEPFIEDSSLTMVTKPLLSPLSFTVQATAFRCQIYQEKYGKWNRASMSLSWQRMLHYVWHYLPNVLVTHSISTYQFAFHFINLFGWMFC